MSDSTANVMDGSAWRNFSRALEAAGAIIPTPYHASYMTAAEIVIGGGIAHLRANARCNEAVTQYERHRVQ